MTLRPLALAALVSAFALAGCGDAGLESLKKGEMAKLAIPAEPPVTPVTAFYDGAGNPVRLSDFRGKVVVLNMWATWCPPCVAEMPTLAKLQADYAGKAVSVVAVSVDRDEDLDEAAAFIGRHAPLAFYRDPKFQLTYSFRPPAAGMPTTIIFGKDGVERARLSGGADWSGTDAKAVIDQVLADG